MKKLLALCIVFALALTLCACGQEAPAEDSPAAASDGGDAELEPITIVFATPNGTANIESVYAAKWIELVEERSEGKITFDYTDSGALGSYTELLEGVQNGVYNMTITEPSYIATYVPESALLSLPLIYDSYDEATAILDGEVGQWYNALVAEKSNLEILNYFYCGFRYVCSEKEIDSLDDCKGVLIRSPEIDTSPTCSASWASAMSPWPSLRPTPLWTPASSMPLRSRCRTSTRAASTTWASTSAAPATC